MFPLSSFRLRTTSTTPAPTFHMTAAAPPPLRCRTGSMRKRMPSGAFAATASTCGSFAITKASRGPPTSKPTCVRSSKARTSPALPRSGLLCRPAASDDREAPSPTAPLSVGASPEARKAWLHASASASASQKPCSPSATDSSRIRPIPICAIGSPAVN